MLELFMESMKEFLLSYGIDICHNDYKNSEYYSKIKDTRIFGCAGGSMSLEEFIERYLLIDQKTLYKSIYDMGNTCELVDEKCEDTAVAKEIITVLGLANESDIEAETVEFVANFSRPDGLIERLKTYLGFDLESFDKSNERYKYERCKILYLIYMLENIYFPKTNVLMLLSKPSMESIDNSFIGMKTYNGMVIKLMKDSLEKELSLSVKEKIKMTVANIVSIWDKILENAMILIDFLYENGYKYDFEETICSLQADPRETGITENTQKYTHSPIETLYLKMVQHEFMGNIIDISRINDMQKDYIQNVSSELVEEMKPLHYSTIDINQVEKYIDENALRISKYVYLKSNVSKDDVRRIRTFKRKICKWMDFCVRARPLFNKKDISNELQVISFLQALILDDQSETFDYIFYGYQKHMKHKPQVQAALKNDKYVINALQCYWARKVTDHWYANIGKYDARLKVRALERTCDRVLEEILRYPNVDEMLEIHKIYLAKVDMGLITTVEQILAAQRLTGYLRDKGFEYVDSFYQIRYVFMNPAEIADTYIFLTSMISDTIKDKDTSLQISSESFTTNDVEKMKFDFELTFDYQNKKCIMQKFKLIPCNRDQSI